MNRIDWASVAVWSTTMLFGVIFWSGLVLLLASWVQP